MKIVYNLNSISYIGGIEHITVTKANALAEIAGNEVFVFVTDYKPDAGFAPQLSPKVRLIDLEIDYFADDWKSWWHVLKGFCLKRRCHRRRLDQVLREIDPDIVVSVGGFEKYFLPFIRGRWKLIREFHFIKQYRHLEADSWQKKMTAFLGDWFEFGWVIRKYDRIVVLTEEDREKHWRGSVRPKVEVIPNALPVEPRSVSALTNKKIVSVGRLSCPKNFQSLIRAYRRVADRHPDWELEIYGTGPEWDQLQTLIASLSLSGQVHLRGHYWPIEEKMAEASCFVLSSLHEGFGLVLAEAMSCGLPVVSYACPCGPRDIIDEGKDGFLVPVGDEAQLAEKICWLIEHPEERAVMGEAAREKSARYGIDRIIPMWMNLFERLRQSKG